MKKRGPLSTCAEDLLGMTPKLSEKTDDKDCFYIKGDMSFGGVSGEKVSDEPQTQLEFAKGQY